MFLSALLFFLPAANAQLQQVSIAEIASGFDQIPGQFIQVSTSSNPNQTLVADPLKRVYLPHGADALNPVSNQDLFKLDARRFIQTMQTEDLLDAKIRFYADLPFNEKKQAHDLPYFRLSGWFSLHHPPVKIPEIPLGEYSRLFSPHSPILEKSPFFDVSFQRSLDAESGTELTFSNQTRALFNGDAIREKVRLVETAKKYVFGAVMAYACDASSEPLTNALIQKAASGVPVTLMMERFYMGVLFRGCVKRLRRGGVDVVLVSDKWKPSRFLSFFHDKFWVRDGEEVIVGGQNIIEFENQSTGFNHLNRDTDLWVSGPLAADFAEAYLDLWDEYATRKHRSLERFRSEIQSLKQSQRQAHLRGAMGYEEKLTDPRLQQQGVCRALIQKPNQPHPRIATVLHRHFEKAAHSILLTSPEIESLEKSAFFIPIRDAIRDRGVKVELISNGIDGGTGEFTATIQRAMTNAFIQGKYRKGRFWNWVLQWEPIKITKKRRETMLQLADGIGLRPWTHFNYMHAKQVYIDRLVTSISSMNLDVASIERNHEAGALCMDAGLSGQMDQQMVLDLVNSVPVIGN